MFNQNYKTGYSISSERLSQILKKDKLQMPIMIEDSLKKEILKVISGYMNIKAVNSDLRIEVQNDGKILISFNALADGIKANAQ